MGMVDLYTKEQAVEALADSITTKEEFMKEVETLNNVIFLLKYFLATGECLDPEVFGISSEEEDLNE